MNLEKNKKTIMWLIAYTLLLTFALFNLDYIFNFLGYIFKILSPFILGAVIAFVLNVLLNQIENNLFKGCFKRKKTLKRGISVVLSLLIIIMALGFIIFLVVPELKNAAEIFVDNLPTYIDQLTITLDNFGIDNEKIGSIAESLNSLRNVVTDFVVDNKGDFVGTTINIATSIISSITNLVIAIVFAIYILVQKEELIEQFNRVMKAYVKEDKIKKINDVFTLSNKIGSNFISGQCLEALIIGLLCFLGMTILRLPYAPTISVLVGFTALIPVFGAFIGTIIGAFLILMVDPFKAVMFVIFILVLQQFEGNLIYPKVVGKSVGLPGIWVLVAVTVGASIGGIGGMLISVPLCSILYSLLETNVNLRLKKKENKQSKNVN